MGYELKGQTISLKAATALTKGTPVKVSGANGMAAATVGTDTVVGILQNDVIATEAGQVMINGISMYKAKAVVAAGAEITGLGIALEAATAVNDIIPVLLKSY